MAEMEEIAPTRRFESVVSPAFRVDAEAAHAIPPVVNMLAFALPAGVGDHYVLAPNARAFRDLNVMGSGIEERSAFEIGMAMCENHKLGTPFLKESVVEEPHTYGELLEMITTRDGKPITSAYENASSASRGSTQYNPRVAERYMELLQTRESRAQLAPPPDSEAAAPAGNDGGAWMLQRNDAPRDMPRTQENGETFVDIAAYGRTSESRRRELAAALDEGQSGWATEIAREGQAAPAADSENDWWNDSATAATTTEAPPVSADAGQPRRRGAPEEIPAADNSMMAHERTVAMTRAALDSVFNASRNQLRNKLTILFAPLYNQTQRDGFGERILEGAVMLILVHDPLWNPGVAVLELEANLRKLNQLSSTRSSSFQTDTTIQDLQFHYSNLPTQNVLHYLNQDHYRNMCQAYVGSASPLPKDERDVSLPNHAAHPFRIFTLERAIERLRETCDTDQTDTLLAPLQQLADHVNAQVAQEQMEIGSALVALPAVYQMDQRDCVWFSRNGTGLAVQFLPWEDGTIQLRQEPDDPEPVRRAIDMLTTTSQGAGALGRRRSANSGMDDPDDAQRDATVSHDGSGDAVQTLAANQRDAIERQIKQFRFSAHAASYDAIQGNVLEVRRSDVNWCVAMGERYVPVRGAFEQSLPPVPGGDPATARPAARQIEHWIRARRRPCKVIYEFEQAGLRLFESAIWKMDSVVTPAIQSIIQWGQSGGPNGSPGFSKVSALIRVLNRFCDPFGNVILHDGLVARHMRRNINATKEVVMLMRYGLNAYVCNGELSNNKMATGPACVGKSYEQDELKDMLIPDSFTVVMSETSFANLSNTDSSDHITLYDEMPYHIVASGKAMDKNGQGSRTKSMLTTGQDARRTVEMVKTASGVQKRLTRIIRSWQEGVTLIASNISIKDVDPAIVSRFLHQIYADVAGDEAFLERRDAEEREAELATATSGGHRQRKPPSIIELRTGQISSYEERVMADYVKTRRITQHLVAQYCKTIQSGPMPDVNMTVCDLLIGKLLVIMRGMGIKMGGYRKYKRVYNTAQVATIEHAISCAFRNQYGGDYRNREYRIPDLHFLKPYLFCTKQIALYAFTSLLDDFINPMQGAVIRGLYNMARFPFQDYYTLLEDANDAEHAIEEIIVNTPHIAWRQLDEEFVDPNYIAFRGTYYDVARLLVGHMSIKPSIDDIVAMLQELSATLVTFTAVNKVAVSEIHAGADSTLVAQSLDRTPNQTMPAVVLEKAARGNSYYVCLCVEAFRLIRATDVVRQALERLVYRGMTPQTFVLGTLSGDSNGRDFESFDTFEVTEAMCADPAAPEAFSMRSGDYMKETELSRLFSPFHSLNADDYDEDGRLVRGALYAAHEATRLTSGYDASSAEEEDSSAEDAMEVSVDDNRMLTTLLTAHDPDAASSDDDEDSSADSDAEDDEEDDDQDDEEARRAAEFCSPVPEDYKTAFDAIVEHLNQGRMHEDIEVREDLDQYAAFLHFQRTGLPLALHSDPAVANDKNRPLSERVMWEFTDPITHETRLRPLPTPHAIIEEMNTRLQQHPQGAHEYNAGYAHKPADVRARHLLPVDVRELPARRPKKRTKKATKGKKRTRVRDAPSASATSVSSRARAHASVTETTASSRAPHAKKRTRNARAGANGPKRKKIRRDTPAPATTGSPQ